MVGKVFSVMEWTDYAGGQVRKIFDTKEKALNYLKPHFDKQQLILVGDSDDNYIFMKTNRYGDTWSITEFDIE